MHKKFNTVDMEVLMGPIKVCKRFKEC